MSRRLERVLLISTFVMVSSSAIAAQENTHSLHTAVQLEERAVAAATEGRAEEALALAARALGLREARLGAGHFGSAPAFEGSVKHDDERLARALGERTVASVLAPSPLVSASAASETLPRASRENARP